MVRRGERGPYMQKLQKSGTLPDSHDQESGLPEIPWFCPGSPDRESRREFWESRPGVRTFLETWLLVKYYFYNIAFFLFNLNAAPNTSSRNFAMVQALYTIRKTVFQYSHQQTSKMLTWTTRTPDLLEINPDSQPDSHWESEILMSQFPDSRQNTFAYMTSSHVPNGACKYKNDFWTTKHKKSQKTGSGCALY